MKKTLSLIILNFATLFMYANVAFADCTYDLNVKNYVGRNITITKSSFILPSDWFGEWKDLSSDNVTLANNTDIYTASGDMGTTCDLHNYKIKVEYDCTERDGTTNSYTKETNTYDAGLTNTVYAIIFGCDIGMANNQSGWPQIANADVSLERQKLPIPGGGETDCLWNTQAGTILRNSAANVEWQSDGNLVVYVNGSSIWSSNTQDNGDRFCFQGDGNLVIYKNGSPTWSIGTVNTGQTLHLMVNCDLVMADSNGLYKVGQWGDLR